MTSNIFVFTILLVKSFILLALFISVAMTVFGVVRRAIKDDDAGLICVGVSLVMAPLLVSWVLTILLYLAPGLPRSFYLIGSLAPFAVLALIGRQLGLKQLRLSYSKYWREPGLNFGLILISLTTAVLLFLGLGGLVALNLLTPLNGNDALEYSRMAQLLAEGRSAHIYPLTDASYADGFVATWTHPLGYINSLTFGYLLQGDTSSSGITRFIAPYFALAQVVLLAGWAGYRRKVSGLLTALFLLSTPLYYALVVQCHIDPARIAAFTAAASVIWLLSRHPAWPLAIVAGVVCGLSMYAHSFGILTLPIMVPAYLIIARKGSITQHGLSLVIVSAISIAMVVHRYIINIVEYGSPISDSVKVWQMEELGVEYARNVVRFMEGPLDKIVNGALMGFSNTELFGPYFYLFLLAVFVWLFSTYKHWRNPLRLLFQQDWRDNSDPADMALLIVAGYASVIILTMIAGSDIAIKNARYILTLQPFILVFGIRTLTAWLFIDGTINEYNARTVQ